MVDWCFELVGISRSCVSASFQVLFWALAWLSQQELREASDLHSVQSWQQSTEVFQWQRCHAPIRDRPFWGPTETFHVWHCVAGTFGVWFHTMFICFINKLSDKCDTGQNYVNMLFTIHILPLQYHIHEYLELWAPVIYDTIFFPNS
jgi:hypothetical protein